jgi:ABC-type uncharacterized transport system substrate-binding protein
VSDEWAIWRCVTHESMRASLTEITMTWTLDDLDSANVVLDAIDVATEQVRRASEKGR